MSKAKAHSTAASGSPNRLKPIQFADVTEMVREALEDAIIVGELEPGTVLVDRHLAEKFQVSRTPVRDALREIEPTGLIRRSGRGAQAGWVVSEFRRKDIHELFALRRALEPIVFEGLHLNKNAREGLIQLADYFDDFDEPLGEGDYEAYIACDREFHKQLVVLSENSRALRFYQILEKQIDRIRHFLSTGYEGRMENIVIEHTAMCEAMSRSNFEEARQALLKHLFNGEHAMAQFAGERGLLVEDENTL